jgi:hypothetical protein
MENIKINYGTSYISNPITGSSFSLNSNSEFLILNTTNGVLSINENLNVGTYTFIINYLNNNLSMEKILNVTVLPNFFYDLNNIKNNSILKPILNPNIDGAFSFDYLNNDIILDENNGNITLNNIEVGTYYFNVSWTVNNVTVTHLINFIIKPFFYYQNNKKIIFFGATNLFSEKPIIEPNISNYLISSDFKINNEGILDLSYYDVGEYNIKVTLKVKDIVVDTYYNLYVKPLVNYSDINYYCDSLTDFKIDSPLVSQIGGVFSLENVDNNLINSISINSDNGEILINCPTGKYILTIKYIKNNAYNKYNINLTVNPKIYYENLVINTNDILIIKPITNENIDGTFNLITKYDGIEINENSGDISINKIFPNFYNIIIEYNKNECKTTSQFKVETYPILIVNENKFDIYPVTSNYKLTSDNKDVVILGNTFNLNNIQTIGNYNITFTLTINGISTNYVYNHSVYPIINYSEEIFYGIYNTIFISSKPNVIYKGGKYKLSENNFIIDEDTGIITGTNLEVGEYNIEVHLIYLSFDIKKNVLITIKPQLIIPSQDLIYSECKLTNINYMPGNGYFTVYDEDYNDFIFQNEFNKLDVGTYNIDIGYTVNNIKSIVNVPITINKKKLDLNLQAEDKEYDNNNSVIINCVNYSEVIINGYYENINVGKNKIIINEIILPDNLLINYYTNIEYIYGNILPKILYPNITVNNKIFDNTNIATVNFDIDVESYLALYNSKNIGEQTIKINNIKLLNNQNYKLFQEEYEIIGNILPKEVNIYCSCKDKTYDGTNLCEVSINKIEGIINKDKLFINILSSSFSDINVGLHNINIDKYEALGINEKNYKITFVNLQANIFAKKLELEVISDNKIYDGTINPLLRFNTDQEIVSYDANYIDKNIGFKKKIIVKNIKLKNNNYYVNDLILYGNVLPKMIDFVFIPNEKIYDGKVYCEGTYTINKNENDNIICTYNAEFKDINSGSDVETITTNVKITGADSNNYKLNSVTSMNGIINKKEITCSFKNVDKMYDKTTLGFVKIDKIYGLSQSDFFDNIQIVSLDAHYEDHFIGTNKKITIENIELEPRLFNYFIKDTYCVGNIILRELNIIFNNPVKIYDGLTDVLLTINNIKNALDNDNIIVKSVKGNFENPNVGKNKVVYVTDIELDDYSARYYKCNDIKIEGTIKEKFLKINFTAKDQEYEPNLIPDVSYELDDPLLEILSFTASYYKIDIGLQKILISNIILGGKNAMNYIVAEHVTFANILPKTIELEFTITDKIFDGTTIANVICITNESINFDANYETINIGNHKVVINNIIQTSTNYIIKNEYIIYGNILPKEIIINPIISKTYDGTKMYNLIDIPEIKLCSCEFKSSNVGINIPVYIKNIITSDSNYFIKDFETIGTIEPKELYCEFIASDKFYDESNKVYFDKIYCEITILSFESYYENINVGFRNIIIENIKLDNQNYFCKDLIISSTIKPQLLQIEFTFDPKIYDKIDNAIISSYKLLNTNDKIKLYSYTAKYFNINVGVQDIEITNLIINSQNYYTDKYFSFGIINPRLVNFNFNNTNKIYDGTTFSNANIISFNNKLLDDKLEVIYLNSEYESQYVGNNTINITNIELQGDSINNYYYNKNVNVIGQIEQKPIDCEFNMINNTIVGKLIGLLNNDKVWIANYISYKKNNNYYIENIILDGSDQNNYILINKIYPVL